VGIVGAFLRTDKKRGTVGSVKSYLAYSGVKKALSAWLEPVMAQSSVGLLNFKNRALVHRIWLGVKYLLTHCPTLGNESSKPYGLCGVGC